MGADHVVPSLTRKVGQNCISGKTNTLADENGKIVTMCAARINIKNIDYFKFKKLVIDANRDDYNSSSKEVKTLCDSVQVRSYFLFGWQNVTVFLSATSAQAN